MSPETELVCQLETGTFYEEAIFLEVPGVIQEETVEYMDLDPLQLEEEIITECGDGTCVIASTDGDIPVMKIIEEPASFVEEDTTNIDGLNAPSDLLWLLSFRLDKLLSSLTSVSNEPEEQFQNKKTRKNKSDDEEEIDRNHRTKKARKPPFTYTELIECALCERGPLSVAELYRWISDTFPYYKANDDRWKNSVRHNLSINPVFRKGSKATKGAGHLWTVTSPSKPNSNGETPLSRLKLWKQQRSQDVYEEQKKRTTEEEEDLINETARAVAAISNSHHLSDSDLPDSLSKAASDIINGVKKEVAVEFIHENKKSLTNDFLNPVPKEVVVNECGFLSHIELNLTADALVEQFIENDHYLDEYSSVFSNHLPVLPV